MDGWPTVEERTLQSDHAPTPFTAEQIRAGCPAGRTITFRVEMPGREPSLQIMRFLAADAEGAEVEMAMTDLKGTPLAPPQTSRGTWEGYQRDASNPKDATRIEETEFETPLGTFHGFRYVIATEENGAPVTREMYFACDLPGPPVRIVRREGENRVMTMTVIRHEPGGAP